MTTSILDAMPGPAMALACWVLGRGLARRAGLPYRGVEGFAYAVGLGTGVGSLLLLGLFATLGPQFSIRSSWILVLFTFGAIGQALVGRRPRSPGPRPPDAARDRWVAAPLVVGILLLASSLAPETGWDALAYHLPVAERIRLHGLEPLVGHLDGEFRLGFDLLYAPMAALHSVQAVARGPAFLHAVCGVALGLAVFAEARRRAGSIAAAAVACLFLVSPAVADLAGTAYVDLAVGLHAFLALACAARALRGDVGRNVLAAGLFAGSRPTTSSPPRRSSPSSRSPSSSGPGRAEEAVPPSSRGSWASASRCRGSRAHGPTWATRSSPSSSTASGAGGLTRRRCG